MTSAENPPPTKTPHEKIAVDFAKSLVAGDYREAHKLLTPEFQKQLSPELLQNEFFRMFKGYASGKPRSISFDEADGSILKEWPAKLPGDVCWAYVSIEGDDFLEAINLLITESSGRLAIREIDWGRP